MRSKIGSVVFALGLVLGVYSAGGEEEPPVIQHGKNMRSVPDTSLKLLEEETHGPTDCGCKLIIKRLGYPAQEGDEEEQPFSYSYDSNGDGAVDGNDISITSTNLKDNFTPESPVRWVAHWKIGEGLPTWAHGHPWVTSTSALLDRRKSEMSGNHVVTTESTELVKYQVKCDRPCNGKIKVTSVFTLDDLSAYANGGLAVTRRHASGTYHDEPDTYPSVGNGTSSSGFKRQKAEAWYGDGSWLGGSVPGGRQRWDEGTFTPGSDSATAMAHVNFLGHNAECRWEGWVVSNSNEACLDPSDMEDVAKVAKGLKSAASVGLKAKKFIDTLRQTTDSIPLVGTVATWTKRVATLVGSLVDGQRKDRTLGGRGAGCSADSSGSVKYKRGKDPWPRQATQSSEGSFVKKGGPRSLAGQTEEQAYQVESSVKTQLKCKILLPCSNHEVIEKATSDTLIAVAYSGGFLPGEAKGRVQASLSWEDIGLGSCTQDITQTGDGVPDPVRTPVTTPSGGVPRVVTPSTPTTPPVTGTGKDVVPGPSSTEEDGSDPSPSRRKRLKRIAGIAPPQPPRQEQESQLVVCHFDSPGPLAFDPEMPSMGYAVGVTAAECQWAGGEPGGLFSGRPMLPPSMFGAAGTEGDCTLPHEEACHEAALNALWIDGACQFADLVHPRACELLGGVPGDGPALADLEPWQYVPGLEDYEITFEDLDLDGDGEFEDDLEGNHNGNHLMDELELDVDGDGFLDSFVEEADCLDSCVSGCTAVSGGFTCDDPPLASEEQEIAELNALFEREESPVAPGTFPVRAECLEVCGYPNHCAGNEASGFQCHPPEGLPEEP
ncbi:MAG: hypothetical protein K0U98_02335 [Deltaproteobacteria bacterium]|nr:hypothetical protein [Deltaproteobacteria bacterium]